MVGAAFMTPVRLSSACLARVLTGVMNAAPTIPFEFVPKNETHPMAAILLAICK